LQAAPPYPGWHTQLYNPGKLLQFELAGQIFGCSTHSLISRKQTYLYQNLNALIVPGPKQQHIVSTTVINAQKLEILLNSDWLKAVQFHRNSMPEKNFRDKKAIRGNCLNKRHFQ
jgi:hypothetical protein